MFQQQAKQAAANLEGTKIKEIILIGQDDIPDDCKSFMQLVMEDDGSLYRVSGREFNPHEDIVAMPYSSGTTGAPKVILYLVKYTISVPRGSASPTTTWWPTPAKLSVRRCLK